jgi:uncharacterized protein (DUF1330 family)
MSDAYLVGHITVIAQDLWAEYRAQVPQTLLPWGGELVFRGKRVLLLDGSNPHEDIVVIRFPDIASLQAWFASPAYQALIPLRQQAANMDLMAYES